MLCARQLFAQSPANRDFYLSSLMVLLFISVFFALQGRFLKCAPLPGKGYPSLNCGILHIGPVIFSTQRNSPLFKVLNSPNPRESWLLHGLCPAQFYFSWLDSLENFICSTTDRSPRTSQPEWLDRLQLDECAIERLSSLQGMPFHGYKSPNGNERKNANTENNHFIHRESVKIQWPLPLTLE